MPTLPPLRATLSFGELPKPRELERFASFCISACAHDHNKVCINCCIEEKKHQLSVSDRCILWNTDKKRYFCWHNNRFRPRDLAYYWFVGDLPAKTERFVVRHFPHDSTPCVNPNHLVLIKESITEAASNKVTAEIAFEKSSRGRKFSAATLEAGAKVKEMMEQGYSNQEIKLVMGVSATAFKRMLRCYETSGAKKVPQLPTTTAVKSGSIIGKTSKDKFAFNTRKSSIFVKSESQLRQDCKFKLAQYYKLVDFSNKLDLPVPSVMVST